MAYRRTHEDERWQYAYDKLPEKELPERYRQAFKAFEQRLRQQRRPRLIALGEGGDVETYYPDYAAMKTESLVAAVLMAAFLWILGLAPVSLLIVPALLLLPHGYQAPVVIGLYGLGAVILTALVTPSVRDTWRHNRLKRAAGGSIGFGTYLLHDAIVKRHPGAAAYYPRRCVHDVEIERMAAHTSGGHRGPSRHHGPSSRVWLHYRDAQAQPGKVALIDAELPGHEPEPAQRLRAWIDRDATAEADPSYGKHSGADLRRPEWAAAWRSFKRRRLATYTSLIAPVVLIIAAGAAERWTGGNLIDEALGAYSWVLGFVVLVPVVLTGLAYRAFRCPRCDQSPRQPLSGTDVTRCLSCGLPIFTHVAPR